MRVALMALAVSACSGAQEPGTNVNGSASAGTSVSSASASSAVASSVPVDAPEHKPIGVKECDDYLARWRACSSDPRVWAKVEPGYKLTVETWTTLAADGATREDLRKVCRAELDAFKDETCGSKP